MSPIIQYCDNIHISVHGSVVLNILLGPVTILWQIQRWLWAATFDRKLSMLTHCLNGSNCYYLFNIKKSLKSHLWSSSQVLEVFQLLWEEIDTCIWYFCSTMCCVPYACYLLFVFIAPDAVRTYIYLKHIKVLINFIFTRQTLPINWWLDNCKSCLFLAVMQEMSAFLTTFVIGFPYTMFLFKPDLP